MFKILTRTSKKVLFTRMHGLFYPHAENKHVKKHFAPVGFLLVNNRTHGRFLLVQVLELPGYKGETLFTKKLPAVKSTLSVNPEYNYHGTVCDAYETVL